MIVQEKNSTISQLNGKLITIINNILKKYEIKAIKVTYTPMGTIVYIDGVYIRSISTDQDLTALREKIKELYETR